LGVAALEDNMALSEIVSSLQGALARSRLATRVVVKVNNQCRAVIGRVHGTTVIDMGRNGESAIIRHLSPTLRLVVDVGANIGEWTQLVTQTTRVDHCLLFEPSSVAVAKLKKRFAPCRNVTIIAAAAGESSGNIVFYEEPDAGKTSAVVPGASVPGSLATTVSVTTIDREIEERGWAKIDYLKIDAEGYDFYVLRGAVRLLEQKRVAIGQFEYGDAWALSGATLCHAVGWLKDLGYECFLLKEGKLFLPQIKLYGEYFLYSNYVFCHSESRPLIEGMIAGSV
jgi:FkbM family methyltransferase